MSLDRLLGSWTFEMDHVQAHVRGSASYERVLDGAFVLMRWTYDHPDFPDAMGFLDDAGYHSFDVRGVARRFDLEVDHEGWSTVRRDSDFWQRATTRFVGTDAMEGSGENSFDEGATWQHDFSVTYERTG
jgi:hypothetical protein